jgi:hypothetical protein
VKVQTRGRISPALGDGAWVNEAIGYAIDVVEEILREIDRVL